jgi:hypothetical protein
MSPDPYKASAGAGDPGSWNRYTYTRGDPINRMDAAGLADCTPTTGADFCVSTTSTPLYSPTGMTFAVPDIGYDQDIENIAAGFVAPVKKGPGPPIALRPIRHSPHRPNRPPILLAVSPDRSDECHDRNPVKEKLNERKHNR